MAVELAVLAVLSTAGKQQPAAVLSEAGLNGTGTSTAMRPIYKPPDSDDEPTNLTLGWSSSTILETTQGIGRDTCSGSQILGGYAKHHSKCSQRAPK